MDIHISVRNLVEFILRSGDIDNRKAVAPENAMQEGSRIHRMIQRRMGSDYHAEVSLQYLYETENYRILIDGRADGIIDATESNGNMVTIDEIKGTYREIHRIKEAQQVHLAQASCYAYFYAKQQELSAIRIRITYCNMETEELKYLYQIANKLPGFLEERGFTAEPAKGVRESKSDLLDGEVKPYYRDFISNPTMYGYQSLHITFYDNTSRSYMEVQLRTKKMDDIAEIGPANHLVYEKRQEHERARRDAVPKGECIYFDEAYERGMKLFNLDLKELDVNMFAAMNNSLINDGCGLYRGRLILPYEHLSRFQNDLID